MQGTLAHLTSVFQDVFNDEDLVISRQTTAKDIAAWDSLMHVTLMVNVEKAFHIRFSSSEVAGLKDVGELVDLIESKNHS
jgi:acyl carrier protein